MAITIVQAEMLSVVVGGILYGLSFFMYGVVVWILVRQRTVKEVHRVIFTAALLIFIFATLRMIDVNVHAWKAFITSGDPILYYANPMNLTLKNTVYALQTFLADGILIYRSYIVWQRKRVVLFPCLLWLGTVATGIHTIWSIARPTSATDVVFAKETGKWIRSFYILTLAANAFATSLIAWKLWSVNRETQPYKTSSSSFMPIAVVILECGMAYTLALVVQFVTYTANSNVTYLITDLVGWVITINFYLVIIRAGVIRMRAERSQVTNNAIDRPSSHHFKSQEIAFKVRSFAVESPTQEGSRRSLSGHDADRDSVPLESVDHEKAERAV